MERVECGVGTFLLDLLAAVMRDIMPARFSVSCLARWALICMSSSAIAVLVSSNVEQCRVSRRER